MITGGVKGKIDRVWDAFWSGGISNPIEVTFETVRLRQRVTKVPGSRTAGKATAFKLFRPPKAGGGQ